MAKQTNLIGRKFGRLTVRIFHGRNKHRKSVWMCDCECGKEHKATSDVLLRGYTKSCGCYRNTVKQLPGDEASFNQLFCAYQINAKTRGYDFSLTRGQFRTISVKNCTYCGLYPLPRYAKNRAVIDVVPFVCNGIDRIDNHVGYTFENSVPCCELCNYMKRGLSAAEFLNHVKRIVSHG